MSTRKLSKSYGVTRKSPGKNGGNEEKETNIDYAWGLARQLSAEKKKATAANAANNIRLEYPNVKLDLVVNNKKKPKSSTMKHPKTAAANNKGKKHNSIKMNLF